MNKEDTINKFNEFCDCINKVMNETNEFSYLKYVEMVNFLKDTEKNFIDEKDIIDYTQYFISVLEGTYNKYLRKMKIEKINHENVSTN